MKIRSKNDQPSNYFISWIIDEDGIIDVALCKNGSWYSLPGIRPMKKDFVWMKTGEWSLINGVFK